MSDYVVKAMSDLYSNVSFGGGGGGGGGGNAISQGISSGNLTGVGGKSGVGPSGKNAAIGFDSKAPGCKAGIATGAIGGAIGGSAGGAGGAALGGLAGGIAGSAPCWN